MALKITSPIGTDMGIIQGLYVRIDNYHINKLESKLNLQLGLYQDENDAAEASKFNYDTITNTVVRTIHIQKPTNRALESVDIFLTSSYVSQSWDYIETSSIDYETYSYLDNNGNIQNGERAIHIPLTLSSSVESLKILPDFGMLSSSSIFDIAYPILKAKLEEIVGSGNITNV
jgi:hypothetical protein